MVFTLHKSYKPLNRNELRFSNIETDVKQFYSGLNLFFHR